MQKRVLITSELDKKSLEFMQSEFTTAIRGRAAGESTFLSEERMIDEVNTFKPEIIIISADKITPKIVDTINGVKMIIVTRGNPVNVDLPACEKKNIVVTCTPARNANCVAELVIAMMISCTRKLFSAFEAVKDGTVSLPRMSDVTKKGKDVIWSDPALKEVPYLKFRGFDIDGKTLGLIGLGAIGRKTAAKAIGLGMNILVYDPYISDEDAQSIGATRVSMKDLLKQADFVSLHSSVTPETKNMIGKTEFELMKSTAFLINTARGALVDHEALYEALKEKKIAGAAVDVFHYEPIALDDPFLKLDNFIITPHIGGASRDVITHHSKMALESIKAYSNGDKIPYRVV